MTRTRDPSVPGENELEGELNYINPFFRSSTTTPLISSTFQHFKQLPNHSNIHNFFHHQNAVHTHLRRRPHGHSHGHHLRLRPRHLQRRQLWQLRPDRRQRLGQHLRHLARWLQVIQDHRLGRQPPVRVLLRARQLRQPSWCY